MNLSRVGDVREMEMHTAEPLIFQPSHSETETVFAELKDKKSQD
jgi:hypothetical protein